MLGLHTEQIPEECCPLALWQALLRTTAGEGPAMPSRVGSRWPLRAVREEAVRTSGGHAAGLHVAEEEREPSSRMALSASPGPPLRQLCHPSSSPAPSCWPSNTLSYSPLTSQPGGGAAFLPSARSLVLPDIFTWASTPAELLLGTHHLPKTPFSSTAHPSHPHYHRSSWWPLRHISF